MDTLQLLAIVMLFGISVEVGLVLKGLEKIHQELREHGGQDGEGQPDRLDD